MTTTDPDVAARVAAIRKRAGDCMDPFCDECEMARTLLSALDAAEARAAAAEAAVRAWLEFNRESKAENPCPDYALRAQLRERAKALSEAALPTEARR